LLSALIIIVGCQVVAVKMLLELQHFLMKFQNWNFFPRLYIQANAPFFEICKKLDLLLLMASL
jgi:glutaredoxin-related protein